MALRAVGVAVWVALAAACAVVFEDTGEAVVNAVGCAVLVAVSVTDLERRIIPNRIILPALVAALVVAIGVFSIAGFFSIAPVAAALLLTRRCFALLAREQARQNKFKVGAV